MIPVIETIPEKKLVGKRLCMSVTADKTFELFHSFMPRRKEIKNTISADVFCVQVFDPSLDFNSYTPVTMFEKWASMEVSAFENIPEGMEPFTLAGGLYVVFKYIGTPAGYAETFRYILHSWLPASGYELDKRPHFDVLGEKYKNNDPASEEDVYIPVKIAGSRDFVETHGNVS
ncbi:MAG: GyrI-like domain-containing protein [Bacteroidetes bacterium]|nr:GyrI-like domain-containing protein [Bacteroidota bacterium]